jgi:hypothetical protein
MVPDPASTGLHAASVAESLPPQTAAVCGIDASPPPPQAITEATRSIETILHSRSLVMDFFIGNFTLGLVGKAELRRIRSWRFNAQHAQEYDCFSFLWVRNRKAGTAHSNDILLIKRQ